MTTPELNSIAIILNGIAIIALIIRSFLTYLRLNKLEKIVKMRKVERP